MPPVVALIDLRSRQGTSKPTDDGRQLPARPARSGERNEVVLDQAGHRLPDLPGVGFRPVDHFSIEAEGELRVHSCGEPPADVQPSTDLPYRHPRHGPRRRQLTTASGDTTRRGWTVVGVCGARRRRTDESARRSRICRSYSTEQDEPPARGGGHRHRHRHRRELPGGLRGGRTSSSLARTSRSRSGSARAGTASTTRSTPDCGGWS